MQIKNSLAIGFLLILSSCFEKDGSFGDTSSEDISSERVLNAITVDEINFEKPGIGQEVDVIGIVDIKTLDEFCAISPCGPANNLLPTTADRGIGLPLEGDVKPFGDGQLVIINGKIIKREDELDGDFIDIFEIPIALKIYDHKSFGRISWREDLINISSDFMEKKYGCTCRDLTNCRFSHDKDMGFVKVKDKVFFTVRWTYYDGEKTVDTIYSEIWLSPLTGEVEKVLDEIGNFDVCTN